MSRASAASQGRENQGDQPTAMAGFRRSGQGGSVSAGAPRRRGVQRCACWAVVLLAPCAAARAQSSLPDAPLPETVMIARAAAEPATSGPDPAGQQTFPPLASREPGIAVPGLQPHYVPIPRPCLPDSCSERAPREYCCQENATAFALYLKGNAIHIYTPKELGALAWRGIVDPFNLMTIVATSAYSVGTDSHSLYGPGFDGIARLSGVALTQDMTGAFFGTFLIPSIDHQDPHYHRMPNASLARRIAHCLYQPFWTNSDTGQGMLNYSTLVGSVADEAVDITYVPYQQVGWGPSAERIASGWATDPVGNFITEFVPDVARHVNVNIVFVQRIIDRVAIEEGAGAPGGPPP